MKYGLSQKANGPMTRAGDTEVTEEEIENRKSFFESQEINLEKITSAGLIHSNVVKKVTSKDAGQFIQNTDALITSERDLTLSVTVADCFPVYFYEPNTAIGIAHAGWRGIVSGIIPNTLNALRNEFGIDFKKLKVSVGPGIQKHHFEIQENILEKFENFHEFVEKERGKVFVDLPGIIKHQLLDFGLQPDNITISKECTFCEEAKYFSFRRDKPKRVQAMQAYISFK